MNNVSFYGRYRNTLDAIPDHIYVVNKKMEITFLNQSIKGLLLAHGYDERVIGHELTTIFPFTTPYLSDEVMHVFETGKPMHAGHRILIGTTNMFGEMHRIPLFDEQGMVTEVVNIVHDVTPHREVQKELEDSRALFEAMVDNANSIILRMDLQGHITYFNHFAENFFGYTRKEITGLRVTDTIIPLTDSTGRDLSNLIDNLVLHADEYTTNENENIKKDGTRVWVSWSNKPIHDTTGNITEFICVGNDITELKRTQAELEAYRTSLEALVRKRTSALEESELRYRFLFEESPAGSIIIGSNGIILDVNASFLKILDYEKSEVAGHVALDFIVPEFREHIAELIQHRFAGEKVVDEDIRVIAKDGSIHTLIFANSQAVVRDSSNSISGILLCGADVTKMRRAEEIARLQREELIRTDKLAALGILVSGVAHEVNNPNNYILLNAGNLKVIWKDVCKALDTLEKSDNTLTIAGLPYSEVRSEGENLIASVAEGAQRIKAIVQNLKDFARQAPADMHQDVDLNKVVSAATLIMANLIRKSTDSFIFNLVNDLPEIHGDFQKIEQVVINLLTNACQALDNRNQRIEVILSGSHAEKHVTLTIKDEGCGMSPDIVQHIFDPFFTTKRNTGGTGLGLAISYSIIKDHHGTLSVESQVGIGTTFRMTLPI